VVGGRFFGGGGGGIRRVGSEGKKKESVNVKFRVNLGFLKDIVLIISSILIVLRKLNFLRRRGIGRLLLSCW
jgi:hypothetical protein